jgi:hypothetical protein
LSSPLNPGRTRPQTSPTTARDRQSGGFKGEQCNPDTGNADDPAQ